MSQVRRHELIVDFVNQRGFANIEQLTSHFMVTPQTIRRDLNQLASLGQVRRHHGGASSSSSTKNSDYSDRLSFNMGAKIRIAEKVASCIPNGASLFINIGTTNEAIARALLHHEELQVVTNNLHVASILLPKEDFNVIIAGGQVRSRDGGIVGEQTSDFINQFKMDFGIIGISAIHEDGSLLDYDYREVRVAQSIIKNSSKLILSADHSKFDRTALARLGHISQADYLYTDQTPGQHTLDILTAHNVNLHIA
ncbi:DeoR/GlpR family transcriptional regulator [Candidatus Njordibacter sp. Uisw_039]|jgi:DeoR family glycerol-3-phosphate regulon repressor|uniref:DeoR/GlpR family transcriptional regulator n=1 Tax=Candidatus Njordibacter sp. Uisw_039 TaxID=3230972 RepID=UPI003A389291|tara:strand:- start:982 stop:1740 length:759 start_codon:yes stop_codon:yes gene_type:complete